MSQITLNDGAIKTSEVAVDTAIPLLSTGINEDNLTVTTQLQNILSNLLRKSSFLLESVGAISWNGTSIGNNGSSILLKINQGTSTGVVTVTIPTSAISGFSLSNGDIIYLAVSRNKISSSFTALSSDLVHSNEGSMPAMASPQSNATNDPTIYIPLCAKATGVDNGIYWTPHGYYWPSGTSAQLGTIISATTIPVGAQMSLHLMGNAIPQGTPQMLLLNPGWALCDGAVIISQQSSFANPGRDANGFPTPSYASSNDKFTPTLNGPPPAFISLHAYNIGDAISDSTNTQLWAALSSFTSGSGSGWDPNAVLPPTWSNSSAYSIGQLVYDTYSINGQPFWAIYQALVPISGPGPNPHPYDAGTSVWQRIWATKPSQTGNPYMRSGHNSSAINPPQVYVRGCYVSVSNTSSYNGANITTLTEAQMPSHNHSNATFASTTHYHRLPFALDPRILLFAQLGDSGFYPAFGYDLVGSSYRGWTGGENEDNFTQVMLARSDTPSNLATVPLDGSNQPYNSEPRNFDAAYIIRIY